MTHSLSEIVLVPYEEAYEAGFEDMPRQRGSCYEDLSPGVPRLHLDEALRWVVEHSSSRGTPRGLGLKK